MLTCIFFRSPEEGDLAKARGNAFVKEANWPFAIREYTDAVKRNPENPVYYSNRAMVYMKVRCRLYNMLLFLFQHKNKKRYFHIYFKKYTTMHDECLAGFSHLACANNKTRVPDAMQ